MLRSEKNTCISTLETVCAANAGIVIVHYHGLSAADVFKLRSALRAQNSNMQVVKNTLARIAAANLGHGDTNSLFKGPSAIVFSQNPIDAAKVVTNFSKTNKHLKVIGGIVEGSLVTAEQVDYIATLPSLEAVRAKLVGVLQAPAAKLIALLQTPGTQLARVLDAHANAQQ